MGSELDQFAEFRSSPDAIDKLDLDALLAIVRRRTPGEWKQNSYDDASEPDDIITIHPEITEDIICECPRLNEPKDESHLNWPNDAAAIVAAVNNFEAVVERLLRDNERLAGEVNVGARLQRQAERQRDELQRRWIMVLETAPSDLIAMIEASVKGGADGEA